jgi:hypothetical protein
MAKFKELLIRIYDSQNKTISTHTVDGFRRAIESIIGLRARTMQVPELIKVYGEHQKNNKNKYGAEQVMVTENKSIKSFKQFISEDSTEHNLTRVKNVVDPANKFIRKMRQDVKDNPYMDMEDRIARSTKIDKKVNDTIKWAKSLGVKVKFNKDEDTLVIVSK